VGEWFGKGDGFGREKVITRYRPDAGETIAPPRGWRHVYRENVVPVDGGTT